MKCLVTGAAGFIGSNLVERLLRDGQSVVGHSASGASLPPGATVAAFDADGRLVGIGRADATGRLIRPEKVLAVHPGASV